MRVSRAGHAGTMESSDIMITVEPQDEEEIVIDLTSPVDAYYHDTMIKVIQDAVSDLGVSNIAIHAVDRGALDCTIRARVQTAIKRALEEVSA